MHSYKTPIYLYKKLYPATNVFEKLLMLISVFNWLCSNEAKIRLTVLVEFNIATGIEFGFLTVSLTINTNSLYEILFTSSCVIF